MGKPVRLPIRYRLYTVSEQVWAFRGFFIAIGATALVIFLTFVAVVLLSLNQTFVDQNRVHRLDTHAENGCQLFLMTLAFQQSDTLDSEDLPQFLGNPCRDLVVPVYPRHLNGQDPDPTVPPNARTTTTGATTTATTQRRSTATTAANPRPIATTSRATVRATTTALTTTTTCVRGKCRSRNH